MKIKHLYSGDLIDVRLILQLTIEFDLKKKSSQK